MNLQCLLDLQIKGGFLIFLVCPVGFSNESPLALNYIVNQSDLTAQMLRNVTGYLTLAETVDVPQFELPQSALKDIYELRNRTSFGADTLTAHTKENLSKARGLFHPMVLTLLAILALMIYLLVLSCVALYFLGRQYAVDVLSVFDWFLVAALFFILGTYMVINSAESDSCVAVQEWADNPQAGTAMSDIFPCVDDRTSNQTLSESREAVRLLVNTVNTFIQTSANTERPPDQFYYNQSGPLMPLLCFPFDYNMQDRACSPQEVSLMNASLVWEKYKCMTFLDKKKCSTIGRLTPGMYTQLVQAANASSDILRYTPIMLNLQNCSFLRETLMASNSGVCPTVKRHLLIPKVGLGLTATTRMLNLILWLVYSNRSLYEVIVSRCVNSAKVVPDVEN